MAIFLSIGAVRSLGADPFGGASDSAAVCHRVVTPAAGNPLDGNIRPLYELEKAAWVWHPEAPAGEFAVVEFENEFEVARPTELTLHVSADERYELSLDGELISRGPDRADLMHWSFASYRVRFSAGKHRLSAVAAWIGPHAPTAQVTHRGGFILAAEGELAAKINTGAGPWKCRRLQGWSFTPGLPPRFVGAQHRIDGRLLHGERGNPVDPAVVSPPLYGNNYGMMRAGWRLHPSPLPDQRFDVLRAQAVRAVITSPAAPPAVITAADCRRTPAWDGWEALAAGRGQMEVPGNTTRAVLLDLGQYRTAYPELTLTGGRDAEASISWAESLYELDADGAPTPRKGNRNEVAGKAFTGVADSIVSDGQPHRAYRPWWWRAGRYVLLTVKTGAEPLVIERLRFRESRYPLEDQGRFACSDQKLNDIHPLLVRGMQACAHETYVDCPYYEQLMYVGDTRLEILTTYAMTPDPTLPKRAIELFDWSCGLWGMAAEHYPSRTPQLSPTFGLLWVSMVRDFGLWRDDPEFVRARLPAVRGSLEQFRKLMENNPLLGRLPGWDFMDWVPGWRNGVAPGGASGVSCLNNLLLVQALRHAAELEEVYGDPVLAARNQSLADRIAEQIVTRFWSHERSLLADDDSGEEFSEHAQCLALLNDVLPQEKARDCFAALVASNDLRPASIYFSHYLLETYAQHGRGDLIVRRMSQWKELRKQGLTTPLESPEPSRSDCHAWGSHPLYHARASLLGVRPAQAGFKSVEIRPNPGPLTSLSARVPHPRGWVDGDLTFDHERETCAGYVLLPAETPGVFRWRGHEVPLAPGGRTEIRLGTERVPVEDRS